MISLIAGTAVTALPARQQSQQLTPVQRVARCCFRFVHDFTSALHEGCFKHYRSEQHRNRMARDSSSLQ
jgi:hypothetical protein